MKKRPRLARPPRPRRPLEWGLTIVAVALVAIAATSLGGNSSSSSAATTRIATVGKGVVQSTVSGNGTLEPARKVELSFGAAGEITAIDVRSGEEVKKGQVLAEVDSSSARASLATAEAALIEAEEAVETAEEDEAEEEAEAEETAYEGGATTLMVGLMSREGTAADTIEEATGTTGSEVTGAAGEDTRGSGEAAKRDEEKKAADAKRAEEEAAPEEKSAEEKKPQESAKEDAVSGESGSSTSDESTEPSGSSAGESSGGATAGGSGISLPTAEANLREAELTVESARQEVSETTLRAPISGTIAEISGSVGETVSAGSSGAGGASATSAGGESTSSSSGSAFIVLAQLHRLKMEVSFSEADIGKVRKGQTATVSIDSMEGTELAGEVTKVSVLPSESGSVVEYPATIMLTQSAKGVRTGMTASAEVVVEQVKNAITISSEALTGKSVTIEEDGKEVTKTVTTGLEGDETTEIISGLEAGDKVVLPEVAVATGTAGTSEGESESSSSGFPGGGSGGFGGGPPSGGAPSGGPGGAP